ncbi:MAG: bifunctional precorrin-2 dehydrogenase/sirohydrochlorin ferrochelatase [Ruminococcus sp.]|nr:bifunctional precorrin-2 dehydrogenase/sirohydrochlorin ferrochelatase [Ruminococcus sp.]MDD5890851.1 bifunctional precorrin-2 dehydrogenase/sirohydrochlorin ferrochelatase [Ruminococcus sp.]
MGYFPFFVDVENQNCLVVGGGVVALRKIEKLLPFNPNITVVSPKIHKEILSIENINIINRKFDFNDLKEKSFVITATDDKVLNKEIYNSCKENNIPVNTVDDKDNCSFIFPALAKNNGVTVAISTSGKSPLYAKYLRKKIENLIQDSESIVDNLSKYREKIKNEISLEENRKVAFEKLLDYSLNNENITGDLVDKIIKDLSV